MSAKKFIVNRVMVKAGNTALGRRLPFYFSTSYAANDFADLVLEELGINCDVDFWAVYTDEIEAFRNLRGELKQHKTLFGDS